MKYTFFITLFLLTFGVTALHAQEENLGSESKSQEETVKKEKKRKLKNPNKYYDPKVASRRSAIIPGWGQIYNDSWWKVPLLYGGFAITIYYIDFNNDQRLFYEGLVTELLAQQAAGQTINANTLRVFRRRADTWRRNRDLLYLVTIGVYALNIVEAAIDAHLKGFDVSENLSLNLKPKLGVINNGSPYLGLGLTFAIGK